MSKIITWNLSKEFKAPEKLEQKYQKLSGTQKKKYLLQYGVKILNTLNKIYWMRIIED